MNETTKRKILTKADAVQRFSEILNVEGVTTDNVFVKNNRAALLLKVRDFTDNEKVKLAVATYSLSRDRILKSELYENIPLNVNVLNHIAQSLNATPTDRSDAEHFVNAIYCGECCHSYYKDRFIFNGNTMAATDKKKVNLSTEKVFLKKYCQTPFAKEYTEINGNYAALIVKATLDCQNDSAAIMIFIYSKTSNRILEIRKIDYKHDNANSKKTVVELINKYLDNKGYSMGTVAKVFDGECYCKYVGGKLYYTSEYGDMNELCGDFSEYHSKLASDLIAKAKSMTAAENIFEETVDGNDYYVFRRKDINGAIKNMKGDIKTYLQLLAVGNSIRYRTEGGKNRYSTRFRTKERSGEFIYIRKTGREG